MAVFAGYRIRPAKFEDARPIARVHIETRITTYRGLVDDNLLDEMPNEMELRIQKWQTRLSEPGPWHTLVAESPEGAVVGFVSAGPKERPDSAYTAEVGILYVLKEHQRRGVGRLLIGEAARLLLEAGHRTMLLWTLGSNPARGFYEKLGGHPVEQRDVVRRGELRHEVAYGWEEPDFKRLGLRRATQSTRAGAARLAPMSSEPLLVIIRGAMGAGKSTLLRSLARRREYRFYVLDADAAGGFHPSDAHGEHLDHDWPIEVQILALHAKIILSRGFNLLTDPGELLTRREVDRFLRIVGRRRRDPRVVLLRLEVGPDAAVARKTKYSAAYVRASNLGWHPAPVPGEVVIETDALSAAQVRRLTLKAIQQRVGKSYVHERPRMRRFPKRPAKPQVRRL